MIPTVDGSEIRRENHLGCTKPCKEWDQLPTSTGAPCDDCRGPTNRRENNHHPRNGAPSLLLAAKSRYPLVLSV